ncbi:GTP 3'8-cyclase [Dissostichus eleginoides]|uniref:GTP 3'8-cyclase n=1 Tax=Dissostichus eleginoides TaxID=100907 RepID=A0AAD9FKM2_DISEL|nr:GTP 3'8-cyclase [Dissostichus eleginoides]
MEPAAHWRFTTSYEKAQWLDICLCGSAGQRDEPRGQRGPQVDFREREQHLSLYGPEQNFRGGEVHRREPKRHTSIRDPPQGSIKSSPHG